MNVAQSCHFSVLRMNQTDELATRRVFCVITLLITDYLFSCKFNSFLSSYRFMIYYCCSFTGADSVFLQDTSLLCDHDVFRRVRYCNNNNNSNNIFA